MHRTVQQMEIVLNNCVSPPKHFDQWRLFKYEFKRASRTGAAIDDLNEGRAMSQNTEVTIVTIYLRVQVQKLDKPVNCTEAITFTCWIAEPVQSDGSTAFRVND